MSTDLQERILSITGHTGDINEALDEMESMKTAVAELYDENQALEILNRKLRLCLTLAETSMQAMQNDAGMFITEKTRAKVDQFFEQLKKTNAVVLSQLIQEESL